MARLFIIYWRDIPAQVIAERGRGKTKESKKIELQGRFMEAIDASAIRADLKDSREYLMQWRKSTPTECSENLCYEAGCLARQLDKEYDVDRLRKLVRAGGALTQE